MLAAPASTTRTLAAGLLGHSPDQPRNWAEAVGVIRILADRVEADRRHTVRYFLDKAGGRLEDGPR